MSRVELSYQHVLREAATRPGADPLGVRQITGAIEHGVKGRSGAYALGGVANEDAPALTRATLAAPYDVRVMDWMKKYSYMRLYLDFLDGDGNPVAQGTAASATITPWYIEKNGDVVRGTPIAGVAHRVEARIENAGRVTLYQLSAINAAGAQDVRVRVAAEGYGYDVVTH